MHYNETALLTIQKLIVDIALIYRIIVVSP